MGRWRLREAMGKVLSVGGLAVFLLVMFARHLTRRLMRIPTPEEREWAEIDRALYS